MFVPATLEVRPFYVTNYPVLSGRFPAIGSRPTVSEPWRLPTKLEAARLIEEAPGHERPAHLVFAFGPGPHSCVNASGDPLRPRGGARCGRVFATAERPHGVGPFDLLGNVWEWDSEGGLYGGLARNRTGGFRLVVDAVADTERERTCAACEHDHSEHGEDDCSAEGCSCRGFRTRL